MSYGVVRIRGRALNRILPIAEHVMSWTLLAKEQRGNCLLGRPTWLYPAERGTEMKLKVPLELTNYGTSLEVQGLRLHAPDAGGPGLIPCSGI